MLTGHHRHGLYEDYKANEGFWVECESLTPIGHLSAAETSGLSFVVAAFKSAAIRCSQLVEISKKNISFRCTITYIKLCVKPRPLNKPLNKNQNFSEYRLMR